MRIVVLGGTGVVGRHVVALAIARGHDVESGSRHTRSDLSVPQHRVDLRNGQGLDELLHRHDVVIDVTNVAAMRAASAIRAFEETAGHVVTAATRARVARLVLLSIVGIDEVPLGYYRGKLAQEAAYRTAKVPVTVLRSTQFHEFPGQMLAAATRGPIAVLPRSMIQPVAARDVASALLDAAEGPPVSRMPDLGGPEIHALPDLARRLLRSRNRSTRVLAPWLPGRSARLMSQGALLLREGRTSSQTFDQWLATAERQVGNTFFFLAIACSLLCATRSAYCLYYININLIYNSVCLSHIFPVFGDTICWGKYV